MANEITIRSEVSITKGDLSLKIPSKEREYDMAGSRVFRDAPSIPTTAAGTVLNFGSLATFGFASFLNLDGTNFVEIGLQVAGTFHPFAKLEPGQDAKTWLAAGSIYARSDTAAVILDIQVSER